MTEKTTTTGGSPKAGAMKQSPKKETTVNVSVVSSKAAGAESTSPKSSSRQDADAAKQGQTKKRRMSTSPGDLVARKEHYNSVGKGLDREAPIWIEHTCRFEKQQFVLPKHYEDSLDYILLPRGLLNDRIEALAVQMRQFYGDEELHVLCILKGSRGFFSKLLEIFDRIHKYSVVTDGSGAGKTTTRTFKHAPYMEHYIRLKSYENMHSTGELLQVMSDDLTVLENKHVLIVEDIIDTGNTLTKFVEHLKSFSPKTIKVASLLEKRIPKEKSFGFIGDFVGFSIPDLFIVGYCLDYNEHFRDLDHVCVMNGSGVKKFAK
ncbi:unnamed protein product [Amoebophrya sp. A120]|nr:unnamed protein product [Amoebophrya sp. A120]|eukprot:GSA120T00023890001.1